MCVDVLFARRCLRRPEGAGVADGYDTVIMWGLGLEPGTLEEPVLFIAEPGFRPLRFNYLT